MKIKAPRNKKVSYKVPNAKTTDTQRLTGDTEGRKPFKLVDHMTLRAMKLLGCTSKMCFESWKSSSSYKGCKEHSDQISTKNSVWSNRPNIIVQATNINNTSPHPTNTNPTYAQLASVQSKTSTNKNETDLTNKLAIFLNEFKNTFSQLLNQNSMILSMQQISSIVATTLQIDKWTANAFP